jgi:hypothetical protein
MEPIGIFLEQAGPRSLRCGSRATNGPRDRMDDVFPRQDAHQLQTWIHDRQSVYSSFAHPEDGFSERFVHARDDGTRAHDVADAPIGATSARSKEDARCQRPGSVGKKIGFCDDADQSTGVQDRSPADAITSEHGSCVADPHVRLQDQNGLGHRLSDRAKGVGQHLVLRSKRHVVLRWKRHVVHRLHPSRQSQGGREVLRAERPMPVGTLSGGRARDGAGLSRHGATSQRRPPG